MPGKKPGSKTSKVKKTQSAKAAPRRAAPSRAEPRKSVLARRRAAPTAAPAPPSAAKSEAKISRKPASDLERMAQLRAAPVISTVSSARPAGGAAGSNTARARLLPETEEVDADGDAADTSSLLAGPRNVKPYVAKRGEQYMSKQQLAHFQLILLSWKRDLMEEVDRTGLERQSYTVLGINLPHVIIPVRPGRDIARLIQVAALDQKLKSLGHNAAREFNERLIERMHTAS